MNSKLGNAARFSTTAYAVALLISVAGGIVSCLALLDDTGYTLFMDRAQLSPLSMTWHRAPAKDVTASSSLATAGYEITLNIPTDVSSVRGLWRPQSLHLTTEVGTAQTLSGRSEELTIRPVGVEDWGDAIAVQQATTSTVEVTLTVAIPNNDELVGKTLRAILSGVIEAPEFAGADTILGGNVIVGQSFRNVSEQVRRPVELFIFSREDRRWWDRWRVITSVLLFTLPAIVAFAAWRDARIRRGDASPIDPVLGPFLATLALLFLLMSAFFLGRQLSFQLGMLLFLGIAVISSIVSLANRQASTVSNGDVMTPATVEENPKFTVILSEIGSNKVHVMKVVREVTDLGLKDAKSLVDSTPRPIKEGVNKEQAAAIKKRFEAAGAKVEIVHHR